VDRKENKSRDSKVRKGDNPMSILSFLTNSPMQLCLMSLDGEAVESKFGGAQRKYLTTDRDIFYVSESVGNIIAETCRKLKIEEREPVVICKAEVPDGRGRKQIRWQVTRVNAPPPRDGPQSAGGFAVPLDVQGIPPGGVGKTATNTNGAPGVHPNAPQAAPTTMQAQPMPIATGNGNAIQPPAPADLAHSAWADYVKKATQARIEIYVDLCRWSAERFNGNVTKPEIQSFLMNVLISGDKNGGPR